jgi:hypothetical protein
MIEPNPEQKKRKFMKRLTLEFDEDDLRKLKMKAADDYTSISAILHKLIKEYIK